MSGGADETLRWTSFPLRDELPRSLLLPSIVLGSSVAATFAFGHVLYGFASLLALGIATRRYLAPTVYTLDADGARASFLGVSEQRRWSEVRGVYRHANGLFLSPFPEPSRLDSFRGLFLRYRGNREEVERFVAARTAEPLRSRSPQRREA